MQTVENTSQERTRPRRLGITSIIIGIVTGLGTCLYLVVAGIMVFSGGGEFGVTLALFCITGIQSIIGLINLTGLILAILALVRREPKKGLAIAGLLINLVALSISIVILWLSIPSLVTLTK